MTVVILGASNKPDRYSYKAFKMLQSHGHAVLLVHPILKDIDGVKVFNDVHELQNETIDAVTLYLAPANSAKYEDFIIQAKPKFVIFNPGTESSGMQARLSASGIEVRKACTLVLLQTGQF